MHNQGWAVLNDSITACTHWQQNVADFERNISFTLILQGSHFVDVGEYQEPELQKISINLIISALRALWLDFADVTSRATACSMRTRTFPFQVGER